MKKISIDELVRLLNKYDHRELHVHHTWKPNHNDFRGNHIDLQESMRHYHINTNGWSDIGQHITLFPDGVIVTGRDFGISPASIKGQNSGAFAVEMLGNFDVGHDVLDGSQLNNILRIAKHFDDQGKYVRFHRENSGKTCPGNSIDKDWFMHQVKSYGKTEEYSDVRGHWAENEIREVIESGVMSGYPDGTFRPGKPVTRAEMSIIISRLGK